MKPQLSVFFCFLLLPVAAANSVQTQQGVVRGVSRPSVDAYLGVPFAAPPTGAGRWRPPQPPASWAGIREVSELPPNCAQLTRDLIPKLVGSEDCLYLNIWVPAVPVQKALPVMVFIHGGGFLFGSSSKTLYEGSELAARGEVIVVTIQYRVGELGYLAHPVFSQESAYGGSGNYGLMDQIAALRWVSQNIEAFGGNPNNVTLFGESAGAASACALMSSPLTTGLFSKVILESNACPALGKRQAEIEGALRVQALGCFGSDSAVRSCLRKLPLSKLMRTDWFKMISPLDYRRTSFKLNVDGYTLPEMPVERIRKGRGQQVPLILGNNFEEGLFFTPLFITHTKLERQIRRFYGVSAWRELETLYPMSAFSSKSARGQTMIGDANFDCRIRRLANAKKETDKSPVYRYIFDYELVVGRASIPATHAMELPFVFQNLARFSKLIISNDDRRVEELFLEYWTRFAKTGNPNAPNLPLWSEYEPVSDNYLLLNASPQMQFKRRGSVCDFWDLLDGTPNALKAD